MVAAQVLLGLWATGLAVAAPQLDFGDSRSVVTVDSYQANIDQVQVVSDVVSALQPAIEAAIAEALASPQAPPSLAMTGGSAQVFPALEELLLRCRSPLSITTSTRWLTRRRRTTSPSLSPGTGTV